MIYYDIQESTFSPHTLVACTKQGICAVLFGYDHISGPIELKQMFPGEELYFESVRSQNYTYNFTIALDQNKDFDQFNLDIVSGTRFQKLVWNTLRTIPKGSTVTYSELASMIDMPKAIRPVASAVASNPISVILPCHRVLPKSGGIGKYRWGTEMKRKLLEREIGNLCT